MIQGELGHFLEEGVSIYLGTRNAQMEPAGSRVTAVRVDPTGTHLVAYVPVASFIRVVHNLEDNGQAALVFGRPTDDRAYQVKGIFVDSREATPDEQPFAMAQWERLLVNLERIGLPRRLFSAWVTWPCIAVRVKVTALFSQTPGPGAGGSLA
jgi:hypothetical protein